MKTDLFFSAYRGGAHLLLRGIGCKPRHEDIDGCDLLTWEVGDEAGDPWVMLHGIGSMAAAWTVLMRDSRMRGAHRMVAPELSVLGGSKVPGGALAVADGAAVVAELIRRRFPGRRAVLVGASLGGWTALRVALDHPELVSRLVLITPGGYAEQDWERIAGLIEVGEHDDARNLVDAMFLRPPLPRSWLRRGFRVAFTSPAVTGALAKLSEADGLEDADLAHVEAPTALIWGEHDGIFHVEVAERMAKALPHSALYRIDTAAHIVQWESPKRLLAAVRDFESRDDLRDDAAA